MTPGIKKRKRKEEVKGRRRKRRSGIRSSLLREVLQDGVHLLRNGRQGKFKLVLQGDSGGGGGRGGGGARGLVTGLTPANKDVAEVPFSNAMELL